MKNILMAICLMMVSGLVSNVSFADDNDVNKINRPVEVIPTVYNQGLPVYMRPIFQEDKYCKEIMEKISERAARVPRSTGGYIAMLSDYQQLASRKDLCEDAQLLLVSKIYNICDRAFCADDPTNLLLTLISNPVLTPKAKKEILGLLPRIRCNDYQEQIRVALYNRSEFFDRQIIPDACVPENYIPPDRLAIFVGDERCSGIITEIYAIGNLTSCYDRLSNYQQFVVRRDLLCEDAQILLVKSIYVASNFDENKTDILLALIANPIFSPKCKIEILRGLGNLGFESNKKRILNAFKISEPNEPNSLKNVK